jgi:branched-chain amino acid transport system permease protein
MLGHASSSFRVPAAIVAGAILFGLGGVLPGYLASDFTLKLANEGLLLGLLALSVAFLMSEAGLVALGAASIYGGSGYLFAIAMSEWGMSPGAAIVFAFLAVVAYAAVLGALIVRTNPLAFMMLTLAAGEMIRHVVMLEAVHDYTGGADGLVVSFKGTILGMQAADFANPQHFWPIGWTAVWLIGVTLWSVSRSRLGATLRAVRQNEERMRFSGFNTYVPRVVAYILVNAVAAVSGLLHVLNAGFVSPESLGLGVSTNALVAALMGGTAGPVGPLAGGLIFAFAQDEFGARGATQLLTGAAIVLFIVVFPRGVVGGLVAAVRRVLPGIDRPRRKT